MAEKRRGRNVEELYNATDIIGEPKITSVLRGGNLMQGPLDNTVQKQHTQKYMASSQTEKRSGKHSMKRKVRSSAESGTCNVCSAPCSSCMHLKLACMGSKGDEFSDEICHPTASSQYSINDGDGLLVFKSRAPDSATHATSEASNLPSVSSSHGSLSENADSKANIRPSDADASAESQMLPKQSSGGAVVKDQFSPGPECLLVQKTLSKKHGDAKAEEGHDDNISCVSKADVASKTVSCLDKNLDRSNFSCSSALDMEGSGNALFSHKPDLSGIPLNDANTGCNSPKVQTEGHSLNLNGKHLDEDPSLHDQGKHLECPIEPVNLSFSKEAASNIDCGGSLALYDNADNHTNGKNIPTADNSQMSCAMYPKLESEVDNDRGDQTDEGFKCSDQVEQDKKLNELDEVVDMQEPHLQSVAGDDSDGSEILEHDVKVCDICGDAGREDLLAICSRCSDGAEHTYCMREMLQKLPEGDWLCEECKLAEETENQKQGSDAEEIRNQNQDTEEKRTNKESMQSSDKRHVETIELAPASKRQATESSLASPKLSSPSRVAAVCGDTSFKSFDKGKVKIAHQSSFGSRPIVDIPDVARPSLNGPRLQTSKGALLKSNSFNALNSKLKVKVVDEVPQKHKGTKEGSLDTKEGPGRMMSKSVSFKSIDLGRSSSNDSKAKMLSSKFSYIQDTRGLKPVKERNAIDRKNLPKFDRPLGSSLTGTAVISTPKNDQRVNPRGESTMASVTSNSKELKSAQSDGKVGVLTRTPSSVSRRGAEIPVTSVRVSSTNGTCSTSMEQNLNQISPKDEPPSSSSGNAERLSNNAYENVQDGLPQSLESSDQVEKARDSSVSRLWSDGAAGLKNFTCQKCKETGHKSENCTVVSSDVSTSRTVREEMTKGSKLKAAIEAAMLKKPGIYRKRKESDLPDGQSSSSVDASGEIASQDQSLVLNKMSEGTHEGKVNIGTSSSEVYKSTSMINVRQFNEHSTDDLLPLKAAHLDSDPYLGKPGHASTAKSVPMKVLAIPELEYTWQGSFEVHRVGNCIDIYAGIQAHLSTCASPKVLDVVNKFPQKIILDEVPRLSTWPRQFNINGAKEENVALYFFAKDFESYESYRGLLDNMMKKDLALKGSLDSVEFFIFPSTQLTENAQRWNMLFFLWGVFKGRRSVGSDSLKKLVIPSLNVVPQDKHIPATVSSSSDNPCASEHIVKETSACDCSCDVPLQSNAPNKTDVSLNGNPDNEVLKSQTHSEKQDGRLDSKSLSNISRSSLTWCPETICSSSSQDALPQSKLNAEIELHTEVTGTDSCSNVVEMRMHGDASHFGEYPAPMIFCVGSRDSSGQMTLGEEKVIDRTNCDKSDVTVARDLNKGNVNMDVDASSEKGPRKRPYLDLSETAPQTLSSTIQKTLWDKADSNKLADGESIGKKLKTGCGGLYGGSSRDGISLSGSFTSQMCDLGSSSSIEKKSDDRFTVEDLGTSERYFFPLDAHHVTDIQLPGNSMPWNSLNDEDRVLDGIPNLELALGAETKSPNKGILPFFGMVDKKNNRNKPPDKVMNKEEDDVSASLSLSLSFPFPSKEQTVKPIPKKEQLVPERRPVNTSLILFGGLSDK